MYLTYKYSSVSCLLTSYMVRIRKYQNKVTNRKEPQRRLKVLDIAGLVLAHAKLTLIIDRPPYPEPS